MKRGGSIDDKQPVVVQAHERSRLPSGPLGTIVEGILTVLVVVGPVLGFIAFVAVIFAPDWVARLLGPRLSVSLLGLGLAASGVAWGAWLWYVFSTRGRQSGWARVALMVGAIMGMIVVGVWLVLDPPA